MQRTIVTILSTNFAGSHFLSLLLGSHSKTIHLGEVYRLRRGIKRMRSCQHCKPPDCCPIVRNVHPKEIKSIYRTIFTNLVTDGQEKLALIDTSKKVRWAKEFLRNAEFQFKYIHLVRDPRALVRRWLVGNDSLKSTFYHRYNAVFKGHSFRPRLLIAPRWKIFAYKWLDQNLKIANFLETHKLDHQVITYFDLASETSSEIMRLMRWIGLDFEPGQLQYWNVAQHGDEKADYEWVKRQKKQGHIDLRWKEFLSKHVCDAIISQPEITALLRRLSLVLGPDGLSQYSNGNRGVHTPSAAA